MLCQIMNALFSVFAKCSEFLNPEAVQPYLCEGIVSAVEFAKNLEDFKEKVRKKLKLLLYFM